MDDVQAEFDINNSQAGLIQTAFIVSFMIFAPIFGYMGDRYNRKYVMIVGITIWSVATLAGSFMQVCLFVYKYNSCVYKIEKKCNFKCVFG